MYKLLFEKRFFKDLDDIPKEALEKIHKVIMQLKTNPRPHNAKKLVGRFIYYRIRVGDYRIVYYIDDKAKEVKLLLVRHRKDVYRSL